MDKETLINKLKEIGTTDDEVQRRDLLFEVTEDLSNIFTTYDNVLEEDKKIKEENEKLMEYNRKLFMRVGDYKTPEQVEKETTGEETKEPRRFENLFDEKGNLKL